MARQTALSQIEAALAARGGRAGRQCIARWSRSAPQLHGAGVTQPADVPEWVWRLERHEATEVLRGLIAVAQEGDEVAALAVLGCLRPGLMRLARTVGASLNEVVSEAAVVVMRFPWQRRNSVAGGLLFDIQQRITRNRVRAARPATVPMDADTTASAPANGELGVERSAATELLELVRSSCRPGFLRLDEAQLIVETRVFDVPLTVVADRQGIPVKTLHQRRLRAEARLAAAAA